MFIFMKRLFIFSFFLSSLFLSVSNVSAATVSVLSGSSINSAIQSAQSGDTVQVNAGVYKEQVDISKPVTLVGSGAVWIDGDCSKRYGIQIIASNVTIRGIGVKKTHEQGIIVRNTSSSNITIEGNTVQDFNCQDGGDNFAAGVASWYGGSNIKVINNTITRRVEISGNQAGKGNGIWFKSNNENPSGGGHTISGNTITGGYDGIGGEEEGSDRGSFDKNTTIENNTIKDCWDDGIQVEGGDVNITVKNNRIEGCGIGIAFAANKIGPLNIENNTIQGDTGKRGVHGQLACYKLGRGGNGTTYLTANDCRIPGTSNGGNGFAQTNKGLSPIVSRKNVLVVSRYVMEFSDSPPAGSSFDEDCMYTSDTGRFIKWGGKRYSNFNEFKSGTSLEGNGVYSQNCSSSAVSPINQPNIPTTTQPPLPTKITTTPTPAPTPTPTQSATQNTATESKKVQPKNWFENTFGNFILWFQSLFGSRK